MQATRKLSRFLKPYRVWAILAPLLMVLEVAMDLMQPRLIQRLIDQGIAQNDLNVVITTFASMLVVTLISAAGGIGATFFAVFAAQGVGTDLRRQLGIVLQDTFLFADTMMENIRYGRLDASDADVLVAARLANADQFIRRLPHGYQTPLTERGSNLSEGQRQLLSIARAVIADPSILILDEATSSVDTRTEKQIQAAMLSLMAGRTSFVIAHRLSTIRGADQILVVNDGEVVERGTHEELTARQGFYHQLYASQFRADR